MPSTSEPDRSARARLQSRVALIMVLVALACSVAALRVAMDAAKRTDQACETVCSDLVAIDDTVGSIPGGRDSVASADDENPPRIGQSMGHPGSGRLIGGTRMPPGPGYTLRHPGRVWGTENTVRIVREAIAKVRTQFPSVHRLAVGDLSSENGGSLSGHFSHQSGRDIDLGMFFVHRPSGYPAKFARATSGNLHFRATWALLAALLDTNKEPNGVSWILLDYRVQKLLHMHLSREGMSPDDLDRIFQYPHGINADSGLIRHYPGHDDHMHVRFRCPNTDAFCTPATGPWDLNRHKLSPFVAPGAGVDSVSKGD